MAKPQSDSTGELQNISMRERIGNLVYERTNGKLDLNSTKGKDNSGDQCDTPERRKILLVTHLMYYGYCFNPVSLYFILKPNTNANNNSNEEEEEVEAIVVEVSNTPWNEMSLYVLHPDSIDTVEYYVYPSEISSDSKSKTYRYKWRKNFHVSPFMTMDHIYDWTFFMPRFDRIAVSTSMIKGGKVPYFNAFFDIRRQPFTPFRLCFQLVRMPVYCAIIQVWIHIEAFWLFLKGVEFIPHPEGSETAASQVIAKLMVPFFMAKDWLYRSRSRETGTKSD
jgi:DUF1365 family protein